MPESATVQRNPYRIAPVVLRIARNPELPGRVEHFENGMRLMRRLDSVGKRKLVILEMSEAGEPSPALQVDALNHYLHTGFGLRYFRRTHFLWQDALAWRSLRNLVGFSPIDAQ